MCDLCVVIPIYKTTLEKMEERSIERTCEILSKRNIFFVAPEGMRTDNYAHFLNRKNVDIEYFAPKFFRGIGGYNRLMLEKRFYKRFTAYNYMLIAQPDAYILSGRDELDAFMQKGYQYWGAPWNPPLKIYRFDFKGVRYLGKFMKPVMEASLFTFESDNAVLCAATPADSGAISLLVSEANGTTGTLKLNFNSKITQASVTDWIDAPMPIPITVDGTTAAYTIEPYQMLKIHINF